jgi:hypothetical protein
MKNFKTFIAAVLALILASGVKDEIYVGPASIDLVTMTPASPSSTETVEISAKITDLKGIVSAKLYYRASTEATFQSVDMTAKENRIFTGTIPAYAKDIKVEYYLEVTNRDHLKSVYPKDAPLKLASYTVGASNIIKLYVNEVFSDGTKDATDPDWFEIYNASEISVDINGYMVYDEGIKSSLSTATPKAKRVLSNIPVIPAKGFVAITTEYNGEAVTFGLSTTGDAVYLENPNGVLVSSIDFNTIALSGKKSYGHKPDGTGDLTIFNNPTKGSSNNNAN